MQKKDASGWTQPMATHVTRDCSFHLPNKDSSGSQEPETQLGNIICRYPPCLSQDCSALWGYFTGQSISLPACWCYSCPVPSAAVLLCLPSASDYTSPAHQQRAALELYKQEVTVAGISAERYQRGVLYIITVTDISDTLQSHTWKRSMPEGSFADLCWYNQQQQRRVKSVNTDSSCDALCYLMPQ